MSGGSQPGDHGTRPRTRARQARATAAAMVVVLVAGCAAAAVLIATRPAPVDDTTPTVVDQARRLAVATAAYDDAGLVQAEALRIAALADLAPGELPGFLQSDTDGYERLRSRSRDDLVTDLLVQDEAGRGAHDQLLATPGYRETQAVAAALGPLPPERVQHLREGGATRSDLAPYESAVTELDALHGARDPVQAQLLQSVAALERAPAGGAPIPWALLLGLAVVVLAVELALAVRLAHLVGGAEADVASEAERRRAQVVSMFLVARRLTSDRPGPAIAATVAEETAWTLDADFAFVVLVDGVTLIPVATYGDVRVARIESSRGLLGRAADTVQAQHETVPSDPALPDERGPLTLVAAPVLMRQRVGAVLVAGRRGTTPFAPDDETALTLLAHVTGGALEHAPVPTEQRPRRRLLGPGDPDVAAPPPSAPGATEEPGDARAADPATAIAVLVPIDVVAAPPVDDEAPRVDGVVAAPVDDAEGSAGAPARDDAQATPGAGAADGARADVVPEALAGADDTVRVLRPDLEVWRDGEPMKLAGASARLLAVLIAHRQPVTVDKLADLLWPDIDLAAGRNRLNVTVHRLRKSLALRPDELVVRSADGIALVPGSRWRIDAWLFWDLSSADRDAADHARAYDLHRAAFCARQFAYEDAVALERDRLLARWADLTVDLLDTAAIDPVTAAERALAFGVADEDVLRRIADAVEAAGHRAQAAVLIAAIDDGRHLG